jgi:hypothetical protein
MRIFRVGCTYGELRSSGYPSFSNTRHEVTLLASLEEGDTALEALAKLEGYAKAEVKRRFGDAPEPATSEMEAAYHRPEQTIGAV